MMPEHIFEFLARRLRSKEPVTTAVRMVLVQGVSAADACRATGILQPSLSRSIKLFREFDDEILKTYAGHPALLSYKESNDRR
jgi:hypothetical protein